ncbi:MAG TPA: hypothetical protein VFN02_14830, partial [Ktedonobacteraceae bacterium]|nr:hypothetical protein [Ktedonobacteraceae bacterium]
LEGPSAYLMKSPPVQHHDDVAREMTEAFIRGEDTPVGADLSCPPPIYRPVEQSNGHKAEAEQVVVD